MLYLSTYVVLSYSYFDIIQLFRFLIWCPPHSLTSTLNWYNFGNNFYFQLHECSLRSYLMKKMGRNCHKLYSLQDFPTTRLPLNIFFGVQSSFPQFHGQINRSANVVITVYDGESNLVFGQEHITFSLVWHFRKITFIIIVSNYSRDICCISQRQRLGVIHHVDEQIDQGYCIWRLSFTLQSVGGKCYRGSGSCLRNLKIFRHSTPKLLVRTCQEHYL